MDTWTNAATLDLVRLLDDAIATVHADTGDHALRLHQLLSKRGNASYNQGHAADAADHYRGALELSPSPQRTVILLSVLGKVLAELGSHAEADAHFTNAYAIAAAGHDREGMLRVLEQRSVAAFLRKDYALLKTLTLEGVALSRELGARTLGKVGGATLLQTYQDLIAADPDLAGFAAALARLAGGPLSGSALTRTLLTENDLAGVTRRIRSARSTDCSPTSTCMTWSRRAPCHRPRSGGRPRCARSRPIRPGPGSCPGTGTFGSSPSARPATVWPGTARAGWKAYGSDSHSRPRSGTMS